MNGLSVRQSGLLRSVIIGFLVIFPSFCYPQEEHQEECLVVGHPENLALAMVDTLSKRGVPTSALVPEGQLAFAKKQYRSYPLKRIFEGKLESSNPEDLAHLMAAGKGKKYIYLCMSYVYHDWGKYMLKTLRNVMAVAKKEDAMIIFPSIFYVFGHTRDRPYTENDQAVPTSSIGKVFRKVETILTQSACDVRSLIVRHSFVFGPFFCDGLMSRVFQSAVRKEKLSWLCRVDIPLQVCYIFDLTNLLIDLALYQHKDRSLLIHYAGNRLPSVRAWLELVARLSGIPSDIHLDSKKTVSFFALFHRDAAAGKEIFYSFEEALLLNDDLLSASCPGRPLNPTDLEFAVGETLTWFESNTPPVASVWPFG